MLSKLLNYGRPKVKKSNRDCMFCMHLIPIGEGDHICELDPKRMVLCEYDETEEYGWCNNEK